MAKVLIVDDDANNRLLLATLVIHAGHVALEAADGQSGLDLAVKQQPALAIVDLGLPDMSGALLIQALRRNGRPDLKIALYTATHLDAAVRELTDLYRISAIISKPGDPRDVLDSIEDLLA